MPRHEMARATEGDGAAGFDFLHGRWTVLNRRLKERLSGCTDWEEFSGVCECWPLLGGIANADNMKTARPGHAGFEGATFRIYNPARDLWTIYWADTVSATLQRQVEGRFEGDVGVFVGQEEAGGRMRTLRFLWCRTGPDGARWEQAYALDEAGKWETNWIMEFERLAA